MDTQRILEENGLVATCADGGAALWPRLCNVVNLEMHGAANFPNATFLFKNIKTLCIHICDMDLLPDQIGCLTLLESLKISDCPQLRGLPDTIGELKRLEILHVSQCAVFSGLPPGIGAANALTEIDVDCLLPDQIGFFPDMSRLTQLRSLAIHCNLTHQAPSFLDNVCKAKSLSKLSISSIADLLIPRAIGQLKNLRRLRLYYCRGLHSLPESLGNIASLEQIEISYSSCEHLHSRIGDNFNLKSLYLGHTEIRELPESIGRLENLEFLDLDCNSNLCELPATIGKLSSLKTLRITAGITGGIKKFPCSIYSMEALRTLTITNIGARCETTPFSQRGLLPPGLTQLTINNCSWDVPRWLLSGPSLRILELKGLSTKLLPEFIEDSPCLEVLAIKSCRNLEALPQKLNNTSLSELRIWYAVRLSCLPSRLGDLKGLQILSIVSCDKIRMLPGSIGDLEDLRELTMHTSGVTSLPESICSASKLETLEISSARNLVDLPESLAAMGRLKHLKILDAPNLKRIQDCHGCFSSLESLIISDCGVTDIPHSILQSNRLVGLFLDLRHTTSHLFKLARLPNLQKLNLSLDDAECPYIGPANTPSLHEITLSLGKAREIPDGICDLKDLSSLAIVSSTITRLPKKLSETKNLLTLIIGCCNRLQYLDPALWRALEFGANFMFDEERAPRTLLHIVDCEEYRSSARGVTRVPSCERFREEMRDMMHTALLCCKRNRLRLPPELWLMVWELAACMHHYDVTLFLRSGNII